MCQSLSEGLVTPISQPCVSSLRRSLPDAASVFVNNGISQDSLTSPFAVLFGVGSFTNGLLVMESAELFATYLPVAILYGTLSVLREETVEEDSFTPSTDSPVGNV